MFVYVQGNPLRWIDPEGLHWWVPDPRRGAIPHQHQGPGGPITIVNPSDPGAWPGDPEHENPATGPCAECDWNALSACLERPLSPNATMDCGNCAIALAKAKDARTAAIILATNPSCIRCGATIAVSKAPCFLKHCKIGKRHKCGDCQ